MKLQKYVYQRKSSEIIHEIVDGYEKMSKSDMIRVLTELRRVISLEVFYPLKQAMDFSKRSNDIDDNYIPNKGIMERVNII